MLPTALDEDFYQGRRSARLPFVENDEVRVCQGVYAGRTGTVVILDRSHEAPRYLVEFGDGTDELLAATELGLLHPAV